MPRSILVVWFILTSAEPTLAATAVATYQFNGTLAAAEPGVPPLVPTDPLALSGFVPDVVLGVNQYVWSFDENDNPTNQQAGLTLNTTGLVAPTNYSVDLVFLFTQRDGGWRRIIDVEHRQSDNGFYVNPQNNLHVYPISGSSSGWTNNKYHHVVLTNDGTTVNSYLDGVSQFTTTTNLLNINNANNPDLELAFFLDNVIAGGQFEFSDGRVALIRLWNGVLDPVLARQIASPDYLAGDYNHDGTVGLDDYDVWRSTIGSTTVYDADGNGNFGIDAADYVVWRRNLGNHLAAGMSIAVPEPALISVAAIGLVVLSLFRSRAGIR